MHTSLVRIFPESTSLSETTHGYVFANEAHSFQLALRAESSARYLPVSIQVTGDMSIEVFKIGYVPAMHLDHPGADGNEISARGVYPDLLYARPAIPAIAVAQTAWNTMQWEGDTKATLNLVPDTTTALWITLNGDGETLCAGEHTVTVTVRSLDTGAILQTLSYTLHTLPYPLAKNDIYYTNWFHCDCLCDIYDMPFLSERFREILPFWLKNAARNGMTALLTPAFTPPLDVPIGHERRNVQLVGITVLEDGEYSFDFSELAWFVKTALAAGIRYFEHCHLFSQWGAAHAPSIYAQTPDGYRRIFGWDTDAAGEAYRAFLVSYLHALYGFSAAYGILDRWVFHVSDEPNLSQLEQYRLVSDVVRSHVWGAPVADAISNTEYVSEGLIGAPVAEINHADAFAAVCHTDRTDPQYTEQTNRIPLWLYYTGGPSSVSNRMLHNTPARTRILGAILYRYGATGFLHWGYNYYYDRMSVGCFDPSTDGCGYKQMAGSPYLVYPGLDGKPIPSIREKLMLEAMQDLHALLRAEEVLGTERILSLLREAFGAIVDYRTIPEADMLLRFRKKLFDVLL